jgi:hypothetical protein
MRFLNAFKILSSLEAVKDDKVTEIFLAFLYAERFRGGVTVSRLVAGGTWFASCSGQQAIFMQMFLIFRQMPVYYLN